MSASSGVLASPFEGLWKDIWETLQECDVVDNLYSEKRNWDYPSANYFLNWFGNYHSSSSMHANARALA